VDPIVARNIQAPTFIRTAKLLSQLLLIHHANGTAMAKAMIANTVNSLEKIIRISNSRAPNTYTIDKPDLLEKIKVEFENVVSEKDYDAMLRLFNLKNALIPNSKLCELIGVKNKPEYIKLVLSILKKNNPVSSLLRCEIDKRVSEALINISRPLKILRNQFSGFLLFNRNTINNAIISESVMAIIR
jgi:hypothetical protein